MSKAKEQPKSRLHTLKPYIYLNTTFSEESRGQTCPRLDDRREQGNAQNYNAGTLLLDKEKHVGELMPLCNSRQRPLLGSFSQSRQCTYRNAMLCPCARDSNAFEHSWRRRGSSRARCNSLHASALERKGILLWRDKPNASIILGPHVQHSLNRTGHKFDESRSPLVANSALWLPVCACLPLSSRVGAARVRVLR